MTTSYKFYVVDDDPLVLEFISKLLTKAGHEVRLNVSSLEALNELYDYTPDCVISDLMMAGVDGLELTRELRSRLSSQQTKIVLISANKNEIWRIKAASLGANGYILKPINSNQFVHQVTTIIENID
ncbi:hypothetical protein MTBPR1_10569 [Candidatus Terasakiella magnetica]|uniref:Response regulatory domain-containing protein n=1 Tax=Candidatus Terasakiella magnetica TaxID=1867952 RepID=A0A1C3RDK3_9PROT|nr:response regulator [Candidatus Terasakiella magnetica]SCA55322.1 hypothetical protein MTBPR1_10569 [Candidatus Terasakiella magnetica]